jgi:hypothetical protein
VQLHCPSPGGDATVLFGVEGNVVTPLPVPAPK